MKKLLRRIIRMLHDGVKTARGYFERADAKDAIIYAEYQSYIDRWANS